LLAPISVKRLQWQAKGLQMPMEAEIDETGKPLWQVSLLELLIAMTTIGLYIAATVLVVRALGSASPGFVDWAIALIPAIAGGLGGIAFDALRTRRRLGAIRCTLPVARSVRDTVKGAAFTTLFLAVTIVCVRWFGDAIPESILFGLLMGLLMGGIFAIRNAVTPRCINVSDYGVAFGRAHLFPWTRVHAVRWLSDEVIEFSFLRRGLGRWRAVVSPAKRDLIEGLLAEHLPGK
jgi:hypothetical protein